MVRIMSLVVAAALLAGCAGRSVGPSPLPAAETVEVTAFAETEAVLSIEDAADDPAIWRNPRDPAASLIVATDKKAGLGVYTLAGKRVFNLPAGRVNNVDLLGNVRIAGKKSVLVAASDRTTLNDGRLALFALDTRARTLTLLARVPIAIVEPYGLCLSRTRGQLYAFVVGKDGTIAQMRVDVAGPAAGAVTVRTMKLATQSEGCVVDERSDTLYVAEEAAGLWRFDARPDGGTEPVKIAPTDTTRLVPDAEGVAIAREGRRGGYVVVSSQGDSAFAVWRLPDHAYLGRFRIAAGQFGAVSETDGIEISTASFGRGLEGGLFIAQDGDNAPSAQNFKLVRWAEVKRALRLP